MSEVAEDRRGCVRVEEVRRRGGVEIMESFEGEKENLGIGAVCDGEPEKVLADRSDVLYERGSDNAGG